MKPEEELEVIQKLRDVLKEREYKDYAAYICHAIILVPFYHISNLAGIYKNMPIFGKILIDAIIENRGISKAHALVCNSSLSRTRDFQARYKVLDKAEETLKEIIKNSIYENTNNLYEK